MEGKDVKWKKNTTDSENHNIVNRGGGAWSRGVLCRGVFDWNVGTRARARVPIRLNYIII